ncbi:hypothetical protein BCR39DRAFT_560442 [Naematelia encephala]|uniref:WD40-repeat-containing domain protein n=1 Tax=Naematelia encephala TaxID=71784 RepID=A0A1Y2AVV6_9TREE|nr:hypothetical protein BCR39DRAFT_560442 [Naematelia encephala]
MAAHEASGVEEDVVMGREDSDDAASLSSGESNELAPLDNEAGPSKSKGKQRSRVQDDAEIDEAMETGAGDDMPEMEEEEEELKALPDSQGVPKKSSRDGMIFPPMYTSSDIHLFPSAYRQLIKDASTRITKPEPRDQDLRKEKERLRVLDKLRGVGTEAFPTGPTTPFTTRLVEKPGIGGEKLKVANDGGDPNVRRLRYRTVARNSALLEPWEAWQGEAWWPEMFQQPEKKKAKGKGKEREKEDNGGLPSGWTHRSEVRLGLEQIGRIPIDKLELLSKAEAKAFLPRPIDNTSSPSVTVHLGPHDKQLPVRFDLYDYEYSTTKSGFVFSAGGPIWGLDWCPLPERLTAGAFSQLTPRKAAGFGGAQYLAVSVLPNIETNPGIGEKWTGENHACIQIWSVKSPISEKGSKGEMKCEMVLCIDGGPGMEIRWLPLGAWDELNLANDTGTRLPKLGILGVVQLDGSLSFYAVPHPVVIRHMKGAQVESNEPLYIRLRKPLLRIEVDDAACTCFDYINGTRVAVGFSNGHGGVWDIGDALRTGPDELPLPSTYFPIAFSAIRTLAVGRHPPSDINGKPMYDEDPFHVIFGAYDGTTTLLDMRDPTQFVELYRMRTPVLASAWSHQVAAPLDCDVDFAVVIQKFRGRGNVRSHYVTVHRGPIWSVGTSEYHTMLATASSDGSVILNSLQQGWHRRRRAPLFWLRMYEIDYDTYSGEYRIVDDFAPETLLMERAVKNGMTDSKKTKKKAEVDPAISKTASWAPQVGAHKVAWHNGAGLGRAGWLASGGASGLGRVDFVMGEWRNGKVPSDLEVGV